MTTITPAPPVSALPEPTTARWQPLRAGVQDIWQYDHATRFVFHRGRVLLRGRNGVGKTKVIEVLLPFLLEGRLEPSRLDPFGTRSRKMHYNLLHPANADKATTIGYVWLEFGRRDDGHPRYLTIGAGLKARRATDTVESWFFVAADRRVDADLDLLDGDRRPRSRPALAEALGDSGQVFQSAAEYRAAVNRTLFGVPPTQYESMVEALLRLRQPHLSERLDPAEVANVLADSLPPLDTEKIREVAEGFERLESHRRELDDRRRALDAVDGFLRVYRGYARTVAGRRARRLTGADTRVRSAADAVGSAGTEHTDATATHTRLTGDEQRIERDLQGAETHLHTLETSDEYKAVEELERAQRDAEEADGRARAADEHSRGDADHAAATAERHEEAERREAQQREIYVDTCRQAETAARRADLLAAHDTLIGPLDAVAAGEGPATAVRGTIRTIHDDRRRAVARVRVAGKALAEAERHEAATGERLREAETELRDAAERAQQADDHAAAADGDHREAILGWAAEAQDAALDDDALAAVLDTDAPERGDEARRRAAPARALLDQRVADAGITLRGVDDEIAGVTGERDTLAAATHTPPPVPPWRTADRAARPGAPLYLLAEFTSALDARAQAGVEAALEACGLLDAWVTPDGQVLDPGTLDAVAVPGVRVPGRTLADVTRPTPDGGVPAQIVTRVLATVAVADRHASPAEVPAGTAWVSIDGRWALGQLRGQAHADDVRYVGETARAAQRARRLAELARRLEALAADRVAAHERLRTAEEHRAGLDRELDAFPPATAVVRARSAAESAAHRVEQARGRHNEADTRVRAAVRATAAARNELDRTAGEVGLGAHVDRLDELVDATDAWRTEITEAVSGAVLLVERTRARAQAQQAASEAQARAARSAAAAVTAQRDADARRERAGTLRDMVGTTRDEILARVRAARQRVKDLTGRRRACEAALRDASRRVGETTAALDAARADHERLDAERADAAGAFRALGDVGVLDLVLDRAVGDAGGWPVRTALEHAREVLTAVSELPRDGEALDKAVERAKNKLGRHQQQMQRDLVAGVRLYPRETGGVVVHDVQYLGRTQRLGELITDLREDVAEREARLEQDEQRLLQRFLEGELHEHLRSRIRDARHLVERMNAQLAACPTAAGQRVRLDWTVGEDAPPGTAQAIDLLLRGAHLLSDDHRAALGTYLQQRLREAREGDVAASLSERLATAFDYRRWFAFTIQVKHGGATNWRRLTRQSHGTGSGGEKAVMLHLPLFAAMAAHYASAATAPRLIVLDEVFAGIDRGTRGQLMGLLVSLDLDAVLTSHDEWGFYGELDGLSTYHLVRDPDVPGVLAEWFVWDGATPWDMTT